MHEAAYNFVRSVVEANGLHDAPSVLDLGGADVNGSIHGLFSSRVRTLDIREDSGCDIVADAATWIPDAEYDVVLCTEVFEHTPSWTSIVHTANAATRTGGIFIATMASRDRPPHNAATGGPVEFGGYYENVHPPALAAALTCTGWSTWGMTAADGYFGNDDLYCWAVK